MKIIPKSNILVVEPIKGTETKADIFVSEEDDNKNLLTCKVIFGSDRYNADCIVITGQYSLYKLIYKGTNYFFLDSEDVIGEIEENV